MPNIYYSQSNRGFSNSPLARHLVSLSNELFTHLEHLNERSEAKRAVTIEMSHLYKPIAKKKFRLCKVT